MPIGHESNGTGMPSESQWPNDVGILAIEMYFPRTYVDQTDLEQYDGVSQGKYTIGLGQSRMGFCSDRLDINSLCLTVTQRLIEKTGISPADVGFLMVGTETLVDKSKSVKSVLMQLFEESGNSDIEGIDTTNACYGGTAALFHAINWIESRSWDGRYAIVVAGDIAIYASGAARPTGGCGAVAMLIGANAPLVLDRSVKATHMAHTYDFYKPDMNSEYPTVDGQMTIYCFTNAVDKCYALFCQKYEKAMAEDSNKHQVTVEDFDAMLFHAPYCKLVQKSVARLAFNEFLKDPKPNFQEKYKGMERYRNMKLEDTMYDKDLERAFISLSTDLYEKKTKPSLLLANEVGNMYTASLYSCLIAYLLSKPVKELSNNHLLMFSYGSGMASTMFSLRISSDVSTGSALDKLINGIKDVPQKLANRIKISPKEFERTLQEKEETHHYAPYTPTGNIQELFPGTYYLTSIDEMYRRKYERLPMTEDEKYHGSTVLNDHKIPAAVLRNGQSVPIHAV